MSTPTNIIELIKELQKKCDGDGSFFSEELGNNGINLSDLANLFLANEEKLRIAVEALEKIKEARVIDKTQGLFADRDSIKKQFLDAHLEPIKKICDEALSLLRPTPLP